MSSRKKIPGYLLHKPSGLARVRIDGKDHWLGKYDSPESRKRYDKLITAWLSKSEAEMPAITVSQLAALFWRHAKVKYGKAGKGPYGGAINWRPLLRLMRQHYGKRQAVDFGPKCLKHILDEMVRQDLSRSYVNCQLGRAKRMFRWAVAEELIPMSVYQRLTTVDGLRYGQCAARETDAVEPVADSIVDATLPLVRPVVADMIRFQHLTGCRPEEACRVRPIDVDRGRDIWLYEPENHKTKHHGKQRPIFVGPKAQAVLRPYLLREPELWCFVSKLRRRYSTDSYRRAIQRACQRAGIEKWSPNQLRHSAGTEIRREFGIETAAAVLGHSNLSTTQIYAEADRRRAMEAARRLG